MNHHRGPRVWQVAVWRGRLRRLIAAGWQALITLRWRLLRRWRMIDPRSQGPRDAAHSWRTTARAPRRRHRCTRLVDLANARCFAPTLADTCIAIVRYPTRRRPDPLSSWSRSRRPCRLRFADYASRSRTRDVAFAYLPLSITRGEGRCAFQRDRTNDAFCAVPRS